MNHLTTITNLEKIISSKKILSRTNINGEFEDTADENIIQERNNIEGMNLNNYVPFHLNEIQFSQGVPYNKSIYDKVEKKDLVILCVPKEFGDLFYLYHPKSIYTKQAKNLEEFLEEFSKIEKKLAPTGRYNWRDHETKQFFMSEILIYNECPIENISKYIVYDSTAKSNLEKLGIEGSKIYIDTGSFR